MSDTLILYSTNTWLAYNINESYYNGEHYAWCSPFFDSRSLPVHKYSLPPTSSPSEIYSDLGKAVMSGDLHNYKIQSNKVGILKGATIKRSTRVITNQQKKDIAAIVDAAQIQDFRPLLYVIPHSLVAKLMKNVPILSKAHPLSVEFIIECLPRTCFDVIELPRS